MSTTPPRNWKQFSLRTAVVLALLGGVAVGYGVWYFDRTHVRCRIVNPLDRRIVIKLCTYYNEGSKQTTLEKNEIAVEPKATGEIRLYIGRVSNPLVDYEVIDESRDYLYRSHSSFYVSIGQTNDIASLPNAFSTVAIVNHSSMPARVEMQTLFSHHNEIDPAIGVLQPGQKKYMQLRLDESARISIYPNGVTTPVERRIFRTQGGDIVTYEIQQDGTVVPESPAESPGL